MRNSLVSLGLISFLLLSGCGGAGEAVPTAESPGIDLPQGVPALVDLGSTSCVPCQMMEVELERLDTITGESLGVLFIDVNKDEITSRQYEIRLIPTQIFFSETGEELFRHEGFMSCDDMMLKWLELGYTFETAE